MVDAKKNDPAVQAREDAKQTRRDDLEAQLDRADALASVPQKVVDPNEAAALLTITGQRPIRDESDAPAPGQLGPHSEAANPVGDPADVNTSVAGVEGDASKK